MKSAGSVTYDYITVSCDTGLNCIIDNRRRVGALFVLYYINTGSLCPDIKLINCRRTECIRRTQYDLFALSLIHSRHFSYACCFAGAVDTENHYD